MVNVILALFIITQQAQVVEQVEQTRPSAQAPDSWSFKTYFTSFKMGITGLGGGPIMFKDTKDQQLEKLTLMEVGGGLQFTFGDFQKDTNHFGLGFEYKTIAKSETRNLSYLTPYLVYEAGFPFSSEIRLGYNLTQGTEGFADNYKGLYLGASLKYTFAKPDKVPVLMGLALYGEYILPFEDLSYASGFIGIRMDVSYARTR